MPCPGRHHHPGVHLAVPAAARLRHPLVLQHPRQIPGLHRGRGLPVAGAVAAGPAQHPHPGRPHRRAGAGDAVHRLPALALHHPLPAAQREALRDPVLAGEHHPVRHGRGGGVLYAAQGDRLPGRDRRRQPRDLLPGRAVPAVRAVHGARVRSDLRVPAGAGLPVDGRRAVVGRDVARLEAGGRGDHRGRGRGDPQPGPHQPVRDGGPDVDLLYCGGRRRQVLHRAGPCAEAGPVGARELARVAIKGKTKRSQGRPIRRPATAPRAQILERRQPWYRATAFPVTLAVIVLAVTLLAAWNRAQVGWSRDDVRRFADQVRAQTDQLNTVLGAGTKQLPGMATAAGLTSGKLKPKDLQVRASGWSAKIDELGQKVANVTVGTPEAVSSFDGTPVNNVGGHVPMLTSVRDAYTTAFGFYSQAATTYQNAGGATTGDLQQKLVTQAQGDAAKASAAMDSAASLLARVMVARSEERRVGKESRSRW